ncbi:MAG: hypothetical protein U9R75_10275 [Candidatus Thermoplasmatota archaeon]|nr:hypothetical protein [Candidatus Thermoplasmatota archaeon]
MPRNCSTLSILVIASLLIQVLPFIMETEGESLFQCDLTDLQNYNVLGRDDTFSMFNSLGTGGFGYTVAAGDIDGDGLDDIAIGAPEFELFGKGGAVMIFFARDPDELVPLYGHVDCDILIYGSDEDDKFGSGILLHDMNKDGKDDLIIGAPYADGIGNARRDSGEVYVLEGRERSQFKPRFDINQVPLFARIYGRDAGDQLGSDMDAADLTGDDTQDLIIRSEGDGGRSSSESENENECMGSWELEIIEGDPTGIGSVDLYLSGSLVRYFGRYVSGADIYASHIGNGLDTGDINGDGYDDLVFSYRFQGSGYLAVVGGGSLFPYVTPGTSIPVHNGPDFDPIISVDLGEEGLEEAPLAVGELNQDGKEDITVGLPYAPAHDTFRRMAGQADVYFGIDINDTGTPGPGIMDLDRTDANTTIWGLDSSDRLGSGVMVLDMDGDGKNEVFVTLPYADGIDNMQFDIGEAYLFAIEDNVSNIDLSDSTKAFMGGQEGSGAFISFDSLQFNKDASDEIMISSPYYMTSAGGEDLVGMVSLLSQRSAFDASFVGKFPSSQFGSALVMDDFDQDGYHDIVVGDPAGGDGRTGYVDLFFGEEGGWSGRYLADTESDLSYVNAEDDSEVGAALASGDLNNDSFPDLVVGAPKSAVGGLFNDAGEIRIYWGDTKDNMSSKSNLRIFGYNVERVGSSVVVDDLNNDGIDDIAYSAPYDTGIESQGRYHAGVVYIMFGPLSGMSISSKNDNDVKIMGSMQSEFAGETLGSGDIDGDGINDLIIGAPKSSRGSINHQGVTYVLKGRSSWPSTIDLLDDDSLKIFGPWPFDEVGTEIEAGDMDGDGKDEIILGASKGDGFQRSVPEAGNVYILKGEFLASRMQNGNVMLRTESNVTICGDGRGMRFGSGLSIGDVTGSGSLDLIIGASGFEDPISSFETGAVYIFIAGLFSENLVMNSTSLPVISGFSDEDMAGVAVASADITGDGKVDILIGATGADPLQELTPPGAVYYWKGKDLFARDLKTSTFSVDGASQIAGELGRIKSILEPLEGPYGLKFNARSAYGYDDIQFIELEIMNTSLPGSVVLRSDTVSGEMSIDATGAFKDKIHLDLNNSTSTNDAIQTWFVDFQLLLEWNFPEPDTVLTRAMGSTGTDTNYLGDPFLVDHFVGLDETSIEILDDEGGELSGWLNSSSVFQVKNISLLHGKTGNEISDNSSSAMRFNVLRPDGLSIGEAVLIGSTLSFTNLTPGEGLWATGLEFQIAPLFLPTGAIWFENATFELDVDTICPPQVSSFCIYPDGKEYSVRSHDDDELVELFWNPVKDSGGSGINGYEITILGNDGNIVDIMFDLVPGDLLLLPRGNITLSILAFDNAGNRGPETNFSIMIDVTEPIFSDPFPVEGSWINTDLNAFSIMVHDDEAGLEPDSAVYRVYRSDVKMLSNWMPVRSRMMNGGVLTLNASVPVANGYGHYIQWKITDSVGISSVSLPYSYNMDTSAPTIEIEENEIFIGPVEFLIEAYMEDILSGLDLSTISYRIASQDEFWGSGWVGMGLTGNGASSMASVSLLPGFRGWGFAQWRVVDIAGNWVESDIVSIFIDDTFPEFEGFTPNGSSVLDEDRITVTATIKEMESGLEPGDVEYSISTMSGWIRYGVGGYAPWEKTDDLAGSGSGTYSASTVIELDEGPLNRIRFRARDMAGNGWVVSKTLTLELKVTVQDLAPSALFTLIPAVDIVHAGESLIVDASASSDPEGSDLTFKWFSDLEGFPSDEIIGSGPVVNITLQKLGVHRIWLEVSDGTNRVTSEEVRLRVIEKTQPIEESENTDRNMMDILSDALFFLVIALLLGMLVGGFIAFHILGKRGVGDIQVVDNGPMIEARYEMDNFVPYCPYCNAEVKTTDEYCMSCGQLFTLGDKDKMEKEMKKGKKRKKKRELLPRLEEEVPGESTIDEDGDLVLDEDNYSAAGPFLEESPLDIEPPEQEELIEDLEENEMEEYGEIYEMDDYEEMEDMDDNDEIEDTDLDEEWGVDE